MRSSRLSCRFDLSNNWIFSNSFDVKEGLRIWKMKCLRRSLNILLDSMLEREGKEKTKLDLEEMARIGC